MFERHPNVICWILCLCGMAVSTLTSFAASAPKPDQVVVYKTFDERELELHFFNPEGLKASDQRPVILFFHGGAWVSGSPAAFYHQAKYLASRGIVAVSAEYRLLKKDGVSPRECVKDGKSAVRWLRAHASELGIDPDQLIAAGGSAGGHVAAATATTQSFNEASDDLDISCVPNALVLFNPVSDNGPKGGWGHGKVKSYWQKISPAHNINEATPPTLIMLGTEDKLIPVATAKRYQENMKKFGLRCDLLLYEGQGHAFFNYGQKQNYLATLADTDRFLASLGYLNGAPTLPAATITAKPQ